MDTEKNHYSMKTPSVYCLPFRFQHPSPAHTEHRLEPSLCTSPSFFTLSILLPFSLFISRSPTATDHMREMVLPGCVRLQCSFPSCIPCPPEER
ncbi:hypothetical protein DNTS_008153 [Danionella cerebrum]|uniref:Uncharacterized protein n=1 Tax=Danionella cerebrum TaxID=2873325 RepID=A0A553PUR9_9TELE|nr:hypothetical protein DNTS_008153 [Danionella translucida]